MTMTTTMIPIRCEKLSVAFGKLRAVDDLDLTVEQGAIYALVGPNGAGKTSAIKSIMNVIGRTGGRAEVFGRDSRLLSEHDFTRIGYVSENQEMPGWMTVGYLMRYLKPFYPTWDDERAAHLLRQFDLPPDRKLRHLSRGMFMKAALASSLAFRPRLVVLDEPFSGLDPLVREELIEGMVESAEESTILVSSHDLGEIETFASHIGFMDRGRLVLSEEMTTLTTRFREVEVTLGEFQAIDRQQHWPERWLRPEISAALVRFIDTSYDPELTAAEVRERFRDIRDISARPVPLRTIFVTMARSSRRITKGAAA
jgi:ABC-2 type transport system ATP-binding protein